MRSRSRSIGKMGLAACFVSASLGLAKATPVFNVNPETGETQAQFLVRTRWWRHARFGMFIHWGIYSVPADGEWFFNNGKHVDPYTSKLENYQVADYAKFARQFNSVKFNANQWVTIAKEAGMKYMVITAKHHDGFCMFNTGLTDYNVVDATPWHYDPMKDLASACRQQGLKFCFYYSFMDWHDPDYLPRRQWDVRTTQGASMARYIGYVKGQLTELLTHYGPIGIIWFDGGWEHNSLQSHSLGIVKLIRKLQPEILINNRLDLPEDYDTPEQTIPAATSASHRLWETCMTINNNWGYNKNDHNFKSAGVLIDNLCEVVSRGGNYLLNVGPDATGVIPQPEVDRLLQIGTRMKVNGQSIYGTNSGPNLTLPPGVTCTQKGHTLYLQVAHWPEEGLTVKGLTTRIISAVALNSHERLKVQQRLNATSPLFTVEQPKVLDRYTSVIRLTLTGVPQMGSNAS